MWTDEPYKHKNKNSDPSVVQYYNPSKEEGTSHKVMANRVAENKTRSINHIGSVLECMILATHKTIRSYFKTVGETQGISRRGIEVDSQILIGQTKSVQSMSQQKSE